VSHFAKLNEFNVVVGVYRGRQEDDGKEAELSARTGDRYVQTSYNTFAGEHTQGGTPLRKNYAAIGYTYDEARDAFIPPQPFLSWLLNEETCQWEAPVARPDDDGDYVWNETTQTWEGV